MEEICEECGGTGIVITCCDDICNGSGHCIHGDGEDVCPICHGEGVVFPFDDEADGIAEGYDCASPEHDYIGYDSPPYTYAIATVMCFGA